MSNKLLFVIPISLVIVGGIIIIINDLVPHPSRINQDDLNALAATLKAENVYKQLKSSGVDMSQGPCLSEQLIPDWVADIAHNPRQPIDDQIENQCQNFRNGKAHHFVELSPEGVLIRIH